MYSSTLSLTSALDGVGRQGHALAALPPGKTRYPMYRMGVVGPVSRVFIVVGPVSRVFIVVGPVSRVFIVV